MKTAKFGCFVVYSIVLIILGMALYKYRAEVTSYISEKYTQTVDFIKENTAEVVSNFKDN